MFQAEMKGKAQASSFHKQTTNQPTNQTNKQANKQTNEKCNLQTKCNLKEI
jgi:hypothetical protein